MSKINCSIIIHTKNEESQLQECLNSLKWSDDIVIYDSYSNDNTEEIAYKNNCRFIQRPNYDKTKPFGGCEATHRNWGLRNITFKYDWLFVIDADERCTESCSQNIFKEINKANNRINAYRIRRRDFFQDTHLYHTQLSAWFIRLFKPKYITYARSINFTMQVNGIVKNMSGYIDHYPFNHGISFWIKRHNYYSSFEAKEFKKLKETKINFKLIKNCFFSSDLEEKKKSQKKLFYKLPLRPFIKFIFTYLIKRGFLDGKAGFNYAILQFMYEYMIVLKQQEKQEHLDISNF